MNWLILFVIIIISVFIHFLCPVHVLRQTDRHSRFCSFVCVCLFVCLFRSRKEAHRETRYSSTEMASHRSRS